jgi:TPR repeat protein
MIGARSQVRHPLACPLFLLTLSLTLATVKVTAKPPATAPTVLSEQDNADMGRYMRMGILPSDDQVRRIEAWAAPRTDDPQALFVLGLLNVDHLIDEGKQDEWQALWERAAAHNYAPAQAWLGFSLIEGARVAPDPKRGRTLIDQAAAQNEPFGSATLGECFLSGLAGYSPDLDKARQLFGKACDADLVYGFIGLANVAAAQGNFHDGLALLTKVADAGSPRAQAIIANWYVSGQIPQDPHKAFKYMSEAVEGTRWRNGDYIYALATLYEQGFGTPKDSARAMDCYLKAIKLDSEQAALTIALRYLNGEGVERDPKRTAQILTPYAERGHSGAEFVVGQLYLGGFGVDHDPAEARKWLRRAADHGNQEAASMLRVIEAGTPTTAPATQ